MRSYREPLLKIAPAPKTKPKNETAPVAPSNGIIPSGNLSTLLKPESAPSKSAPVTAARSYLLALRGWERNKSKELKRIRYMMGKTMLGRAVEIKDAGGLKCWLKKHFPSGELPYESARHWYLFAERCDPQKDLDSDESYTDLLIRLDILGEYRQQKTAARQTKSKGRDRTEPTEPDVPAVKKYRDVVDHVKKDTRWIVDHTPRLARDGFGAMDDTIHAVKQAMTDVKGMISNLSDLLVILDEALKELSK